VEAATANIHGPFTEAEFAVARERLGVPASAWRRSTSRATESRCCRAATTPMCSAYPSSSSCSDSPAACLFGDCRKVHLQPKRASMCHCHRRPTNFKVAGRGRKSTPSRRIRLREQNGGFIIIREPPRQTSVRQHDSGIILPLRRQLTAPTNVSSPVSSCNNDRFR
jgi:hypothetical protein